jgi:hypothetical protein
MNTVEVFCNWDWRYKAVYINDENYKLDSECLLLPTVYYNEQATWEIPSSDIELVAIEGETTRGDFGMKLSNKVYKYKIKVTNCHPIGCIIPIIEDLETKLQKEKCKFCNNNKEIVFVPCGHFVCCEHCSLNCRFCPVCKITTKRVKSEMVL